MRIGHNITGLLLFCMVQLGFANTFHVGDLDLNVKSYYENCEKKCPEIDYKLLDTGNRWLDDIINKDVIDNIAFHDYEENSVEHKSWQNFLNNPKPTKAGLTNQLNLAIDSMVKANNDWQKESESDMVFSVTSKPSYLGHKTLKNQQGLEQFSVTTETYTGGAHGMQWLTQYVFNMNTQKKLTIDDIVIQTKKSALEKLAKQKYHEYLKKNDVNPKDLMDMWQFFLTDNFSFDNKGLVLIYQPYEITPYVMGMPELHISYAELSGIVKAEYL